MKLDRKNSTLDGMQLVQDLELTTEGKALITKRMSSLI